MSESSQGGAGQREVAYRLFAAEFDDANLSYSESDEERAPNYVVTPTGARVNRLFVVGVLTEVEQVGDDVLRGRVVDPTGAFVTYAGQYQPDEQAFLERVETPTFVAITGKARTFQPDDSEQVFTSVRPESINEVSAETRDRWTVQAAEQTLERIGHASTALSLGHTGDDLQQALVEAGVDEGLADGIPIALEHYGTTPTYLAALRDLALDAVRVIAGEREEVTELTTAPDESGSVTAADLTDVTADVDVEPSASENTPETETSHSAETPVSETESTEPTASDPSTAETAEASGSTEATAEDRTEEVAESAESQQDEPADELGDFDAGEFELEAETREQIEEEYGTEFQTGTEVDDAGEADIEIPETETAQVEETETDEPEPAVPDSEETVSDETPESAPEEGSESEPEETPEPDEMPESEPEETVSDETPESEPDESETEAAETSDSESEEQPDDLQAAVVDLMAELDDGDGAQRQAVVDEMASRYDVDEDETGDAIQDALMAGECYEPDDTTLKPI